jgi:ABC-2 type transport system permease protein
MKNALKAEIYKLFSVRSTYVVVAFSVVASFLLSFIGEGLKYANGDFGANKLSLVALQSTQVVGLMVVVVAILHITNEYRYNTISYTLTAINSRTKVLLAKIISTSIFSILFSLLIIGTVVGATYLGLQVANAPDLPKQDFPLILILKIVFYNTGLALMALLTSVVVRSIAAALVMMLLGYNIIEGLLSIVLKQNAVYLPLGALNEVIGQSIITDAQPLLSPGEATLLFSAYLLGGGLITWYLFLRRDAN